MEKPSDELIATFAVQCGGANPESLLAQPITVTVDVSKSGVRKVSCPFLEPARREFPTPENRIVYICTATGQGHASIKSQAEVIVADCQQEHPNKDLVGRDLENYLIGRLPQCIHKNPL